MRRTKNPGEITGDYDRTQTWPKGARIYIKVAVLCLFLYGVLGKGFAYLGMAPVYIGEVLLFSGIVIGLKTRKMISLSFDYLGVALLVFMSWQALCSLPYLKMFGLDTFRDSVLWGYALFAWITAALVLRLPLFLIEIIQRFKEYGNFFVFLGPCAALLSEIVPTKLPQWPSTGVTLPSSKCGDLCVHLAGIMCFFLVGLAGSKTWWLLPCLFGVIIGSSINRGGGIAFAIAVMSVLVLYPMPKRFFLIFAGILAGSLLLTQVEFGIKIARSGREISSEQLLRNIRSLGSDKQDTADLQGTKRWRLEWWHRIFMYTFEGPYFWTGKGYGVNLTVSDGIESSAASAGGLRNPHNSHLTFLARSGVPGLAFWLLLQLSWAGVMVHGHFRARALKLPGWAALFAWVSAYWLAFLVNASFDVSLEGPTIAVPFWSLWGLGWGASIMFRRQVRRDLAVPDGLSLCATSVHYG